MRNPFVYLYAVLTGRLSHWNTANAHFDEIWSRLPLLPPTIQPIVEELLVSVHVLADHLFSPLRGSQRLLPVDVKTLSPLHFSAINITLLEGMSSMFVSLNPRLHDPIRHSLGLLLGEPDAPFELFDSLSSLKRNEIEHVSHAIYSRILDIVGLGNR